MDLRRVSRLKPDNMAGIFKTKKQKRKPEMDQEAKTGNDTMMAVFNLMIRDKVTLGSPTLYRVEVNQSTSLVASYPDIILIRIMNYLSGV